jgi:hypothetical protein
MFKSLAIGFVIAIAVTVLSALFAIALGPHASLAWAFAPGFTVMRLFGSAGAQPSNRSAINATFLLWWLVSFVALELFRRQRAT